MKRAYIFLIVITTLLFCATFCYSEQQNTYSINKSVYKQFSNDKTSYKQVGEVEDVSYARVGRYQQFTVTNKILN